MEQDLNQAQTLDREDVLAKFRNYFFIPQIDGKDSIYLCGNSLGLMPNKHTVY